MSEPPTSALSRNLTTDGDPSRMPKRQASTLTNAQIAELLAREAVRAKMPAQKALRRASRRALFWPEETGELHPSRRSLTEITAVGPYLQRLIATWLDDPPEVQSRPIFAQDF